MVESLFSPIWAAFATSELALPNVEDWARSCCTSLRDRDRPVPSYLSGKRQEGVDFGGILPISIRAVSLQWHEGWQLSKYVTRKENSLQKSFLST